MFKEDCASLGVCFHVVVGEPLLEVFHQWVCELLAQQVMEIPVGLLREAYTLK